MRRLLRVTSLVLALALFGIAPPASALITDLMPLSRLIQQGTFIVQVEVDRIDPEKPGAVLTVKEQLKGKAPFDRLPVLLRGDEEAAKEKQTAQLLKRLAPRLSLVLFINHNKQSGEYLALGYSNGTWFQLTGVKPADSDSPRWSFTHLEPYLRRTYKGTTAELSQLLLDVQAGKKKPPVPDAKEKPGLGPEVEAPPKEKEKQSALPAGGIHGGPLFGVIPSVLVGGPLAVLAMLFPALFGGLILVLRRWAVALSVISLNSTLYLAQGWFGSSLRGTRWGSPAALWLTMAAITALGILWAWRRHLKLVAASTSEEPAGELVAPRLWEVAVLLLLSLGWGIGTYLWMRSTRLDRLDLGDKTWLMFGVGICVATLYALVAHWRGDRAVRGGVPPEGVLLWAMLIVAVGLGGSPSAGAAPASVSERVVWRFYPPIEAPDTYWIASSPVVDKDCVYIGVALPVFTNPRGTLYCLDRETGEMRWSFNDGGKMKDVFSSPTVADGLLFVGEGFHQHTKCKLYCLDAATGEKKWDFQTSSHTESTPAFVDGRVYFGAGDDGLYCLEAATGKEVWRLKGLHVDASPTVVDGRVYCGSGVGDIHKESVLFCLDAATGKQRWRIPTDLPAWGGCVVDGGRVYAGIGNGNFLTSDDKPAGAVLCLNAETGQRLWRHDARDGILGRVALDGNHVYYAGRDGYCYCVKRPDGKPVWKRDLGSPVVASPAFVDRGQDGASLYVATTDGQVFCLDTGKGKIDWVFDVGRDLSWDPLLLSSPALVREAADSGDRTTLFVGCARDDNSRGVLYCLEEHREHKPAKE